MKGPLALAERWRDEAAVLRRCGRERTATLCETHATQMMEAFGAYLLEPLSIEVAAEESGYSPSRLYSLVESGVVENAGKPGAPLIRRCDLPRRPQRRTPSCPAADRVSIVDAALSKMRKGR